MPNLAIALGIGLLVYAIVTGLVWFGAENAKINVLDWKENGAGTIMGLGAFLLSLGLLTR